MRDRALRLFDTTGPTIDVPADFSVEASNGVDAVVNYTVTISDPDGVDPSSGCDPASGSTLAIGSHTIVCNATDLADPPNSSSNSFTVTVTEPPPPPDTTAPTITTPGNLSAEATSSSGAAVSYSVTANDPDDAATVSCSPGSGAMFPLGATAVTCNASDTHSNTSSATFTITVADTTGPVFSNVPANLTSEAVSGAGAPVTYTNPTANDAVSGPQAVTCSPTSGSTFPVATTTVNCTASDAKGNSSSAPFTVKVQDTTPPALFVPGPHTVFATSDQGVSDSDPTVTAFVNAASATDIVDPHPVVGTDIHAFVPIGQTVIKFFARDFSGNGVSRDVVLTVLPKPAPGTAPLPPPVAASPPGNVTNVRVIQRDGAIGLTWQLPANCDHVLLSRSAVDGTGEQVVYSGKAASFTDEGLDNGVEYRYVIRCADPAGNRSAGIAVVAMPLQNRLRSPKDGARLRKPPKLLWASEPDADYYNVQLFRNGTRILAVWPKKTGFTLTKTWKYRGKKYTLRTGTYQWYVWPGFGARKDANYGTLLGVRTFQIRS